MFAFVGSQYRLSVSERDYFIDLLLYRRRALVAIDLKIGEFLPEYVGKMQFYLTALDDKVPASRVARRTASSRSGREALGEYLGVIPGAPHIPVVSSRSEFVTLFPEQ